MNNLPFVSVLIPSRNEEKHIFKCLESIINNDYPKDKLEILVIDGMSEDKTREIILNKFPSVRIIDNPNIYTSFAWNIGIKEGKGDVFVLMGAHSAYDKEYISKSIKYLMEYNADNVGGVRKAIPSGDSILEKAIAICLGHYFGAGNATFKTGSKEPRFVDTVFGGCYRKEVFDKVGLFNEKLSRSQDMEFNIRLKKAGGKILLAPDIITYYYPRNNLINYFKHNFDNGLWAIYPLKFAKTPLKLRHYIPLFFTLALIICIALSPISLFPFLAIIAVYLIISLYFSLIIAIKEKDIRLLFLMPIIFFIRHFAYGLGSIYGTIKLIF